MLVLVQLDSVSPPLLDRLCDEGRLPTLAALQEGTPRRRLRTPDTGYVGLRWTLHSGTDLGRHGAYYPFMWSASEQRIRFHGAATTPPAIWDRIGEAGGRSLVMDAYDCVQPARISGTFINGWQFRNKITLPERFLPRERRQSLSDLGRAPLLEDTLGQRTAAHLLADRESLLNAPARLVEAAARLIDAEPYDLFYVSLGSMHLGGHLLWDLDAVPPLGASPEQRSLLDGSLADIYQAVDRALPRLLDAVPADADVILFSPVGMGDNESCVDLLPDMLRAVLTGGARAGEDHEGSAGSGLWRLRAAVPLGAREAVARAIPDRVAIELTARLQVGRVDWARTRAFTLPSDKVGYVRLNVRGREREGIVAPAVADDLLVEIAEGLLSFTHSDGTPVVEAAHRRGEFVGDGPAAEGLPDLMVEWTRRQSAGPLAVRSGRFGEVRRRGLGTGRSGNHSRDDAWAIVLPGRSRERELTREPWIVDLAATACALAGADTRALGGEPLLAAP